MYYVLNNELLDLLKSDVTILCKNFFDVTYFHNVFFNDQNFKYSMPNIPNNLTKCTLIFWLNPKLIDLNEKIEHHFCI